jgi:hypothetical protein
MLSSGSLSLLAFVLLQLSTSRASPTAPVSVSAQAITTTTAILSNSNPTHSIQSNALTSTATTPSTTALASPHSSLINIQPRAADSSSVTSYSGNLLITYAPITTTSNGVLTTIPASTPSGQGLFATPYPSPPPPPTSGLSLGEKAAIGTGAVVACIFLGMFFCCVCAQTRQRKSTRRQDLDGKAPGARSSMLDVFSPRLGKPYDNYGEGKDANGLKDLKPTSAVTDHKHTALVHEARQPPPAGHQQSHGWETPQANFKPPNSPTTSTALVQDAMYSPVEGQGQFERGR